MPILTAERLPKYRKHKASGQALVTLNGVDYYLGPHGTKASKLEYDRLVADWLARGRTLAAPGSDITIVELLAAFRRFAVGHYRKNGQPTRSLGNLDDAVRPLKLLYGREPVAEFGPKKLKAVRHLLVKGFTDPQGRRMPPLARKTSESYHVGHPIDCVTAWPPKFASDPGSKRFKSCWVMRQPMYRKFTRNVTSD